MFFRSKQQIVSPKKLVDEVQILFVILSLQRTNKWDLRLIHMIYNYYDSFKKNMLLVCFSMFSIGVE